MPVLWRTLTCPRGLMCTFMVSPTNRGRSERPVVLARLVGHGALSVPHCRGSAGHRKMKAERSPDSNAERVERWTELAEVCTNWWQRQTMLL